MTTQHMPINWFAGDDWEIRATLLDENGEPYNLAGGQEILWILLDANRQRMLDEDDVTITIIDAPEGVCSIIVPATETSPLPAGQYTDFIRIIDAGITSTLATGAIYVAADPWLAAAPSAVLRRVS